jgi:hypothetical protein
MPLERESVTLFILLLDLEVLPPPLETGKSNTISQYVENKEKVKIYSVGPRARERYWKAESGH